MNNTSTIQLSNVADVPVAHIDAFLNHLRTLLIEHYETRPKAADSLAEAIGNVEIEKGDILWEMRQRNPAGIQREHYDMAMKTSRDVIECSVKGVYAQ
ncbi:hypothetical protein Q4E40_02855 [Pontibacter sp. BT731]|uniref:hypothetical protein n=1 Tax=Pontibacter coccineus TaxID=3063328 RepID=UPI0026E41EEF|nr:hypothetical protein [Pontibacter sp. BT731]MDO6389053.1 hypothetical protein [Pontibacter sp. BT731]